MHSLFRELRRTHRVTLSLGVVAEWRVICCPQAHPPVLHRGCNGCCLGAGTRVIAGTSGRQITIDHSHIDHQKTSHSRPTPPFGQTRGAASHAAWADIWCWVAGSRRRIRQPGRVAAGASAAATADAGWGSSRASRRTLWSVDRSGGDPLSDCAWPAGRRDRRTVDRGCVAGRSPGTYSRRGVPHRVGVISGARPATSPRSSWI
jgi:hypothetical protein